VRRLSRQNKRESWNRFVCRLERDMTGAKRFGFEIFKNLRNEENDRAKINITEQCIQYYREMLVEEEKE
jgi:hypothetical protein